MKRLTRFHSKGGAINHLKENGKLVGKELHLNEDVRTEYEQHKTEPKEHKTVLCSTLERIPKVVSYFK